MVCREVEKNDLVAKYVSGQLDPAAQDDFEIHILDCESCRASVEILQVVREDLIARAHEIRAYSPKPRGGLRWRWVTVSALCVLALAVGLRQLGNFRSHSKAAQVQLPPTSKQGPVVTVEETNNATASSRVSPSDHQVDNVPVNRRDYLNFNLRTDSHVPRDKGHTGASDGNKHQVEKPAPNNDFAEQVVELTNQQEDIPAILDKLTLPRSLAQDKNFLAELASLKAPRLSTNDEQQRIADEALDHLASVQAPPYAFSGVAGTKHSSATANSVVTGGNTGADLPAMAQTIFHEAMLAYAEKRYGDTETLLQSAIQSAPGSIDINYYLGICRLLGDRANEAIEPLQLVLTREKSPYSQSAHFYLGKAYLQMRDITHAQLELELAAAVPGRLTAEATSTLARLLAVLVFESEKKEETIQGPHKKN